MQKLKQTIEEYGRIVIMLYFGIFFLSFCFFWCALTFGVDIKSWSWFSGDFGDIGGVALAYAATKILQPVRIALTLALTPVAARVFPFLKKNSKEQESNV